MSSLLSLKILGSSAVGLTSVGGIAFLTYKSVVNASNNQKLKKFQSQKLLTGSNVDSSSTIFVVAESIDLDETIEQTAKLSNSSNRNYTCKLSTPDNKSDANCSVKLIDSLVNNKKQLNLNELKALQTSNPIIKELSTKSKYFKVIVSDDFYFAINWTNSVPNIDIFSAEKSPKKIGSLKPIIGLKNNDVNGKTSYSVGKVTEFKNTSTVVSGINNVKILENETKCLFLSTNSVEVPCKVNKFVQDATTTQSNLSELVFQGLVSKETSIDKDKYYLFMFIGDENKKQKSEFNNTSGAKVKVVGSIAVSEQSNTVNTLEISDLSPAILLDTDGTKSLLILN